MSWIDKARNEGLIKLVADTIHGLSKSQHVVVVIALGLALGTLGSYLVSIGNAAVSGWYAFGPLSRGPLVTPTGLHPWLRVIVWLVLIGVWALGSIWVLKPSSEDASSG